MRIKLLYRIVLLAALMFTQYSCNKEEEGYLSTTTYSDPDGNSVKACINAFVVPYDMPNGTRAEESSIHEWKDGDVIYLLFERANGENTTGTAVYDADAEEWTVTYRQSLAKDMQAKCIAFYIDGKPNTTETSVVLTAENSLYTDSTASYLYPSGGQLIVNCKLKPNTGRIRLKSETPKQISVAGIKYISSFDITNYQVTYSDTIIDTETETPNSFTPYLYGNLASKTLSITYLDAYIDDRDDNIFTFTADYSDANIMQRGKSGWISIPTLNAYNGWDLSKKKYYDGYVDLGLPSGTLWAKYDLGTTDDCDGLVYAWGETEGYIKGKYSWESKGSWSEYKLCAGTEKTIKKYVSDPNCSYYGSRVDNKNELELIDDAAYQYNTHFRIPSQKECQELLDECKWSSDGLIGPNGNVLKINLYSRDHWERNGCNQHAKCWGFGAVTISPWESRFRCYRVYIRPIYSKDGF